MHIRHTIEYPVHLVVKHGFLNFSFIFPIVTANDTDTHDIIHGEEKVGLDICVLIWP